MNEPYYIYGLIDPRTKEIFYIGFTGNTPTIRLLQHITRSEGNPEKQAVISDILAADLMPSTVTLEVVGTPEEATAAEKKWIKTGLLAGWPLTNITHAAGIKQSEAAAIPLRTGNVNKKFLANLHDIRQKSAAKRRQKLMVQGIDQAAVMQALSEFYNADPEAFNRQRVKEIHQRVTGKGVNHDAATRLYLAVTRGELVG